MGWCVMAVSFTIWLLRPDLLAVDPLCDTVRSDASVEAAEEAEAVEKGNIEAKITA